MTRSAYHHDSVAWAKEQAELLRAGQFDQLDLVHLADEIEDVGKSEQRELASRMAVLLAHLLKWHFQPEYRGVSWEVTIRTQRHSIARRLNRTPSLRQCPSDADWWADVWDDALAQAVRETQLTTLPDHCPWSVEQVLDDQWWPGVK